MRTFVIVFVVVVTLGASSPAVAGGYDWLWFEQDYYRPGEVVRAEAGVSTPSPVRATWQLTRVDGRELPSAVVRPTIVTEPLTDREYVDPEGGSNLAEYRVELEFRLPALPSGEYWIEAYCGIPCRATVPWVGGTFFVVGPMPIHGLAWPDAVARAS